MIKGYTFEINKGNIISNKKHFSHHLSLEMSREQAWRLIDELLANLKEKNNQIIISRCGALEKNEKD